MECALEGDCGVLSHAPCLCLLPCHHEVSSLSPVHPCPDILRPSRGLTCAAWPADHGVRPPKLRARVTLSSFQIGDLRYFVTVKETCLTHDIRRESMAGRGNSKGKGLEAGMMEWKCLEVGMTEEQG